MGNYKAETDIEELLIYRLKNDNSEAITIEILNLYKDSPPTGNMLEAIKSLSESSANKKIKDLAKSVIEGTSSSSESSSSIEDTLNTTN